MAAPGKRQAFLTRWNITVLVTFPSLSNVIGKKSLIIWALHEWKLNGYSAHEIIICDDYWHVEVIEILCKISSVALNILYIFTFSELFLLHFYSRYIMSDLASYP